MAIYNAKFGGNAKPISRACTSQNCCTSDDPGLCSGEDLDGDAVADLYSRDLEKRAGPRKFTIEFPSGNTLEWRSVSVCKLHNDSLDSRLQANQVPVSKQRGLGLGKSYLVYGICLRGH